MTASTLAAFLLARLDEDETAAREATGEQWDRLVDGAPKFRRVVSWGLTPIGAMNADGDAAHIARHDPARVLREVEAKRAIVERHRDLAADFHDPTHPEAGEDGWVHVPGIHECAECHYQSAPCDTLRHLASVYRDHPDFDEGWLP